MLATCGLDDLSGALLWVGILVSVGFSSGQITGVKNNFSPVIVGNIIVSVVPGVTQVVRAKRTPTPGSQM